MDHAFLRVYDKLWDDAVAHIVRDGVRDGVQADPHLLNREGDQRQPLTLIARPSREIQAYITHFLQAMEHVVVGQYFYAADTLHLTSLSLIRASIQYSPKQERLAAYCHICCRMAFSSRFYNDIVL